MTRSLVTGAAGFAGRYLVAHLAHLGDDVRAVDRDCDVTDASSVTAVLEESRPDVIYHLAALTHVGESWERPQDYTRVNVVGTQRVIDAARSVVPEATIVVVSSSDVYGVVSEDELPLVEESRVAPANPYAASKVEAERIALAAWREFTQRVIVVRPFNHIGPRQSSRFVVPALAERLVAARRSGSDTISVGDLSARRDFSDVRDVVRAYALLAEFAAPGEVYQVASGRDVAIAEVADRLVAMIAPGTRLVTDDALRRPVELPVSCGSAEKLRATTGWRNEISLDQSLRDIVEWIENS